MIVTFVMNCKEMKTIMYIHGMGGGSDSRIPSILRDVLCPPTSCSPEQDEESFQVVCRTYSFDPEEAAGQIAGWVRELKPDLIIGESLGCLHALRLRGVPKILISPALNAPQYFEALAWLTLIPGVTWLFDRIYKPREGDRQPLHFTFHTLRKYLHHRKEAMKASRLRASKSASVPEVQAPVHAFIGTRDHYLRSGIVSRRTYKKHFGATCTLYDGSHFTEEEYIHSLVIPKIKELMG